MLAVRRHISRLSLLLLVSFGSLFSCAGSNFDGHVFRQGELAFRVGPLPPSFRAIEVDEALLAFRDDPTSATIAVNGRCGLDGDDVPLRALTHHLFLHFTERTLLTEQELMLDGRAALRTELVAELDGVPMHYVVYVLKKDGCVYDFMLVSAERDSPSRPAFERFVRGFGTLR